MSVSEEVRTRCHLSPTVTVPADRDVFQALHHRRLHSGATGSTAEASLRSLPGAVS